MWGIQGTRGGLICFQNKCTTEQICGVETWSNCHESQCLIKKNGVVFLWLCFPSFQFDSPVSEEGVVRELLSWWSYPSGQLAAGILQWRDSWWHCQCISQWDVWAYHKHRNYNTHWQKWTWWLASYQAILSTARVISWSQGISYKLMAWWYPKAV